MLVFGMFKIGKNNGMYQADKKMLNNFHASITFISILFLQETPPMLLMVLF